MMKFFYIKIEGWPPDSKVSKSITTTFRSTSKGEAEKEAFRNFQEAGWKALTIRHVKASEFEKTVRKIQAKNKTEAKRMLEERKKQADNKMTELSLHLAKRASADSSKKSVERRAARKAKRDASVNSPVYLQKKLIELSAECLELKRLYDDRNNVINNLEESHLNMRAAHQRDLKLIEFLKEELHRYIKLDYVNIAEREEIMRTYGGAAGGGKTVTFNGHNYPEKSRVVYVPEETYGVKSTGAVFRSRLEPRR